MEVINIVYHDKDLEHITKTSKGDWLDLRSAETVEYKAGDYLLINLGVSMKLPKGYEAYIVPRSSSFKNFGFIQPNSPAIIDGSYCGTNDIWKYPIYALRDGKINKNDRICQFRIMKNSDDVAFHVTNSLANVDRGGFGSTGIE